MAFDLTFHQQAATLITTMDGFVTADDLSELFKRTAEFIADSNESYFQIMDVTQADADFKEIMAMVKVSNAGGPGTLSDSRLQWIIVGQNQMFRLLRDMLMQAQFGAYQVMLFTTLDDAFSYIELELERRYDPV